MNKIGIIICSRLKSNRLPNKCFLRLAGSYIIEQLIKRLEPMGISIILAVPEKEFDYYDRHLNNKNITLFSGCADDPLFRTYQAAKIHDIKHIIRITHDKIFISPFQIKKFIKEYFDKKLNYIYSNNFIDGMSFEIFDRETLKEACRKFKDVEHISFAIDDVAKKKLNLKNFPLCANEETKNLRLLIDYPEDYTLMKHIFRKFGKDANIDKIIDDYDKNHVAYSVNALPKITIYTCGYNAGKYLSNCMHSIYSQKHANFEHIFIDDASTDNTSDIVKSYSKTTYIRNDENKGLSSSSNIALKHAKGKYVIRLDADDYFLNDFVISNMLKIIEKHGYDAMYPDNKAGDLYQRGCDKHHVGGTMYRKRVLDFVKFTDGLRHYEGLDLYKRLVLKDVNIGYYEKPTFFYRQHAESLSSSKSPERKRIENMLANGKTGAALL